MKYISIDKTMALKMDDPSSLPDDSLVVFKLHETNLILDENTSEPSNNKL